MSSAAEIIESQQALGRLSREGFAGVAEIAVVTSPGARTAAWAVKVTSLSSYNVYNVIAVAIHDPGAVPSEFGRQIQAINLAEPFTQQGTLPAGTYAVMSRVGDKNVFYVKP
jgi:hypothetical protein